MSKGEAFEIAVRNFLENTLPKMDFLVKKVRRQKSGTQNGFDIRVELLTEDDIKHNLFFECKDYTVQLQMKELLGKVFECNGSTYKVDCFIGISPKQQISNIDDNTIQKAEKSFGFPIEIWDTDNNVAEFFSLDKEIYKEIYGSEPNKVDEDEILHKWKRIINEIISRKVTLNPSQGLTGDAKQGAKKAPIQHRILRMLRPYGSGRLKIRIRELKQFGILDPQPIVLPTFYKKFGYKKGDKIQLTHNDNSIFGHIVGFIEDKDFFTFPPKIVSELGLEQRTIYRLDYYNKHNEIELYEAI